MKSNRKTVFNRTDRANERLRQTFGKGPIHSNAYAPTSAPKKKIIVSRNPNSGRRERPLTLIKTSPVTKNPKLLLDVPNVGTSNNIAYPTPKWFQATEKADVSVIVPLYKSSKVIEDLISSWPIDNGYKVEIVFVDDFCPQNSKDAVLRSWTKRSQSLNGTKIGKLIYNTQNLGYGGACNTGAQHATGDYLIFLNADTKVSPGWIEPIVRALKDKTIGVVGNLQLKEGGMWDGTIDSAGSEWCWESKAFVHIGRHIYHGKFLPEPYKVDTAPTDIVSFGERDMVTGCCFGIRADLFRSVGGFNPNYRIGYWEDSELCMSVKEKGYRVVFEPKSVIYHKLGHTNSGAHKFQDFNREYFANKWIKTGRIDPLINNPRKTIPQVGTILIQRRGAHGDVLAAASICPALKKKHPGCKILFTTHCPEVLEGNPYIDKIVREEEISERMFQVFYNLDLAYEYRPHTPIIEAYADTVGVDINDCKPYLTTKVSNLNAPIVIHAGKTQWVGRDWPVANFAVIAQRLIDQGENVVCIGRGADGSVPGLDLRGKTSIAELAGIMQKAKMFIGIDSFPMHVAQTFEVPGVCFFGSINPSLRLYTNKMKGVTAINLSCLGCHHRKPTPSTVTSLCETGTLDCVKSVSVEQMWAKIDGILKTS